MMKAASVGVNFLGEPFLSFDELKEVYRKVRDTEESRDMGIDFAFTTNGTVINDEILAFIRESGWLCISVDGPKEVHDRIRVDITGNGTYDRIIENLPRFRDAAPKLIASTTLTAYYPKPLDLLYHIVNLGFDQVMIKPVRAGYDKPYAFGPDKAQTLKDGYTELRDFLIVEASKERFRHLVVMLNEFDIFGRFLLRVLLQTPKFYRCPAGKYKIEIDGKGDIYPCPEMIGKPVFLMGNIRDGIDHAKEDFWWSLHCDYKPVCKDCWARFLCGGGCHYLAWLNYDYDPIPGYGRDDLVEVDGRQYPAWVLKPDKVECELFKHLAELAIEFVYRLQKEHPEQFEKVMIMAQERM
jgi:uncharacterized protein